MVRLFQVEDVFFSSNVIIMRLFSPSLVKGFQWPLYQMDAFEKPRAPHLSSRLKWPSTRNDFEGFKTAASIVCASPRQHSAWALNYVDSFTLSKIRKTLWPWFQTQRLQWLVKVNTKSFQTATAGKLQQSLAQSKINNCGSVYQNQNRNQIYISYYKSQLFSSSQLRQSKPRCLLNVHISCLLSCVKYELLYFMW